MINTNHLGKGRNAKITAIGRAIAINKYPEEAEYIQSPKVNADLWNGIVEIGKKGIKVTLPHFISEEELKGYFKNIPKGYVPGTNMHNNFTLQDLLNLAK